MLKWEQVNSSAIQEVAYDEVKHVLLVKFASNDVYSYEANKGQYDELVHADSAGKHFNAFIKPQCNEVDYDF